MGLFDLFHHMFQNIGLANSFIGALYNFFNLPLNFP